VLMDLIPGCQYRLGDVRYPQSSSGNEVGDDQG
jgi:hypothetical protein